MAQSAPQLHNLHAAYRRMYQALEVQNIEELLPAPPRPQPTDPVTENARILMGELAQAFPDQLHDIHIALHVAFMKTPLVSTSPAAMGVFYAHILEHLALKARNDVQAQIVQLMEAAEAQAAAGQASPQMVQQMLMQAQQQMQDPAQIEQLVAIRQKELMDELLPMISPQGPDPMADPLVMIRMRELELKNKAEERKTEMEKAQLLLDAANQKQRATTDAARLELQEQIADERNEVNRERIEVQRQASASRQRAF
jgi:hypothetical protein